MAAPKGNQNAVGNKGGGKSVQDRQLSAEVRTLALNEIKKVLEGKETNYKRQLILKLAGTVLPRLNEHSGNDGEPIQMQWLSSPSPMQPGSGQNSFTLPVNVG